MNTDNEPVLIVKDGEYLVEAGEPILFDKEKLTSYLQQKYTIEIITIKQYRSRSWTFTFDKIG